MRSLRHLLDLSGHPGRRRGIGLRVLKQNIHTTTRPWSLTFHILASVDTFQRELIAEGT